MLSLSVGYISLSYAIAQENETPDKKREYPMGKLNGLRIIEIPDFRAVSSGSQPNLLTNAEGGFMKWHQTNIHLMRDCFYANPDFIYHEKPGEGTWIWAVKDDVTAADCAPYDLIEFKGGMYAVTVIDGNDGKDTNEVVNSMIKWIVDSDIFVADEVPPRYGMGHMIGVDLMKDLGWEQYEIFLPIKYKVKPENTDNF